MSKEQRMRDILESVQAYQQQMSYASDLAEKYRILEKMKDLAKEWERLTGQRMSGTENLY